MPSSSISPTLAVVIVGLIDILILVFGYFVLQQILLSVYIAVLASLIAGLVYVAWSYFSASDV